jgi:hypothetical protein
MCSVGTFSPLSLTAELTTFNSQAKVLAAKNEAFCADLFLKQGNVLAHRAVHPRAPTDTDIGHGLLSAKRDQGVRH